MLDQSSSHDGVRLIGVGVGPGDPELLTVKAVKALASADAIFVPETEARADAPGRAEEIVLAQLPEKADAIRRVPFSMAIKAGAKEIRAKARRESADAALAAFAAGAKVVAFATIGDPSVYSTFSYLAELVCGDRDNVTVEIIPGITAMQTLAAASGVPLCEGKEILALVPATIGPEKLAQVCEVADNVTIYKGGRHLAKVKETLEAAGRLDDAVMGINLGLAEQEVSALADQTDESAPYFSTIQSPPKRGN